MKAKTDKAIVSDGKTKVRATQVGFYDGIRRREGDVFILAEGDRVGRWMEVLEGSEAKPPKPSKVKNEPKNEPDLSKPNGDQQPGDETGLAEEPSTGGDLA